MPEWTDEQIDWYAEKYGEDPTNRWLVDAAGLQGDEAVLDIGCGTGAALRHAAAQGHKGALTGIDAYPRMIHHAKARRGDARIDFLVAAAEDLPFADAAFDAVLAINSVHHWADVDKGLAEVARVLRLDGLFTYGGEVFDPSMIPEGQDYSDRLTALGFRVEPATTIENGAAFAARAQRGQAHV